MDGDRLRLGLVEGEIDGEIVAELKRPEDDGAAVGERVTELKRPEDDGAAVVSGGLQVNRVDVASKIYARPVTSTEDVPELVL